MPKHVTIRTARGNIACTVQGESASLNGIHVDIDRIVSALRFLLNTKGGMLVMTSAGPIKMRARRHVLRGWSYEVELHGVTHDVPGVDLVELLTMLEAQCQCK